jgi:CheY-like chemotaxis protein
MNSHPGMQILVLEDDDLCLGVVRDILKNAGFSVICARGFDEAIAPIENGTKIDIALVDVHMPLGTPSGVSFARMAQLRRPALKLIFMSTNNRLNQISLLGDGEIFLPKPFDPNPLLQAVARAAA